MARATPHTKSRKKAKKVKKPPAPLGPGARGWRGRGRGSAVYVQAADEWRGDGGGFLSEEIVETEDGGTAAGGDSVGEE